MVGLETLIFTWLGRALDFKKINGNSVNKVRSLLTSKKLTAQNTSEYTIHYWFPQAGLATVAHDSKNIMLRVLQLRHTWHR